MEIGQKGLALIKSFEKCYLEPYDDGYGYKTIGWGLVILKTDHFTTLTQQEADALLLRDLTSAEHVVDSVVSVPLSQSQYDALVSFQFNTGHLPKSTLLMDLNKGNIKAASEQFHLWIHSSGKVSRGLIRRRDAEEALFNAKS